MSPEKASKYLNIAYAVAELSKDDSTKVGALILGQAHEIRSMGYNGAPRGCSADEDQRKNRPEKYFWYSHAEVNAITNAARMGTPLDGCHLIVTHFPCMDCARAIVQSGIKSVYTPKMDEDFKARWHEHTTRSFQLFNECGIFVAFISKQL